MQIRKYKEEDSEAMLDILRPYIEKTAINFEYDCPEIGSFSKKLKELGKSYPCLVLESEGEIAGYAYASEFRTKKAYAWSVESTIYLKESFRGKGAGYFLYKTLLEILEYMGFVNVYGGVTLPNKASCALHEGLDFSLAGTFNEIGYKFGKWHSIVFYQKKLSGNRGETEPMNPEEAGREIDRILEKRNSAMNDYPIRKADKNDLLAIKELTESAYATLEPVMTPDNFKGMMQSISSQLMYDELLKSAQCWVCERENRIVGSVFLMKNGHDFRIFDRSHAVVRLMGVSPDHRGKGIARRLMQTVIAAAKANQETVLALHTSESMPDARHVYESLGFRIYKEMDRIWNLKYWMYHLQLK